MLRFCSITALGATLILQACAGGSARHRPAASPATQRAAAATAPGHYGAPITLQHALTTRYVFDNAASLAGQTMLIEGVVEAVCQKKGCWLTLGDGRHSLRMSFKDYGFFVPKDLAGSTVQAQGVFSIREIPVAEQRHYLEDAGRHDEARKVTRPEQQYVFVAEGVRLRR